MLFRTSPRKNTTGKRDKKPRQRAGTMSDTDQDHLGKELEISLVNQVGASLPKKAKSDNQLSSPKEGPEEVPPYDSPQKAKSHNSVPFKNKTSPSSPRGDGTDHRLFSEVDVVVLERVILSDNAESAALVNKRAIWKKQYLYLEEDTLVSYKKENKRDKCLHLSLPGTQILLYPHRSRKFCFQILTPYHVYRFSMNSREDLLHWVQSITKILKNSDKTDDEEDHEEDDSDETLVQSSQEEGVKVMVNKNVNPPKRKVCGDDFTILKVIGEGGFSQVYLVKLKESGKLYAMKVLSKKVLIQDGYVNHTKNERSILMKLEFPFLMKLHYSFHTQTKLYFILDYINGGEIFYHLSKQGRFSEERTRFYCAEVALSLSYLHEAGIIYRDLKPENLLLDSEGHIVLTDFGLSKEGLNQSNDRTGTFCGTAEYLAPELILGESYTKAIDWWAFGCLMYEMLVGGAVFHQDNHDDMAMYRKILNEDVVVPKEIGRDASDLITRLLTRNLEMRLKDPNQIKKHPFFKDIDWNLLLQKKIAPPFIPPIESAEDTQNFDTTFTRKQPKISCSEAEGSMETDPFEGFTFVADWCE